MLLTPGNCSAIVRRPRGSSSLLLLLFSHYFLARYSRKHCYIATRDATIKFKVKCALYYIATKKKKQKCENYWFPLRHSENSGIKHKSLQYTSMYLSSFVIVNVNQNNIFAECYTCRRVDLMISQNAIDRKIYKSKFDIASV